ncbi:hypothetical protein QEN19_001215 [Hanseniaspora menglaensis]
MSVEFSPNTHILIAINGVDLFQLGNDTQLKIMNKINEGYYRNNSKFKLMEGQRIIDLPSFSYAMGFNSNPDKCVFYIFLEKNKSFYNNMIKNPDLKKEVFLNYEIFFVNKDNEEFMQLKENDIKGTVGFKPHHSYPDGKTIEPTCFTTFIPKLGSFLLPFLEKHFAKLFNVEQYIVEIIIEHNLYDYYTKYHNYVEIKRYVVPIDYDPEVTGLEKGIILNRPMTMSVMKKIIKC